MTDQTLLTAFVEGRDEQAFAELVRRYVDVVYSAARRQLRNEHLAEDVTQAVFILLAHKARSISGGKVLAGWLINSARLCARTAARREARLKAREQRAAMMRSETVSSPDPLDAQDIRPKLDEALAALNVSERTAVALRYLQGKAMKEVAATMDISEAAAAKRVARGTTRMRRFLARRGVELAPAGLADAICRQTGITTPPLLTSAAIDAGVTAAKGGAMTSAASQIAADVAAAASPLRWMAAALLAVILLSLLAVVTSNHPVPAQSAPTAPASRPSKIRVGFYLSHLNAISPEPATGQPMGYVMRTLHELTDPSFDLIPVIEPDTRELGELPMLLKEYFRTKTPVDAANVADLKTLDVLVAGPLYVPDAVIDAMEEAVKEGMGLMTRNRFAVWAPGFTEPVKRLYGATEADYTFNGVAVECEVLVEHPTISSRKGKAGAAVRMRPNGVYGILAPGAEGIIRWKAFPARAKLDGAEFYTIYCHELGRGRVLHCCYATYDTPKNVADSVGPQFMIRSIKWLAKRPVE